MSQSPKVGRIDGMYHKIKSSGFMEYTGGESGMVRNQNKVENTSFYAKKESHPPSRTGDTHYVKGTREIEEESKGVGDNAWPRSLIKFDNRFFCKARLFISESENL